MEIETARRLSPHPKRHKMHRSIALLGTAVSPPERCLACLLDVRPFTFSITQTYWDKL
jgi:hypothetical protein